MLDRSISRSTFGAKETALKHLVVIVVLTILTVMWAGCSRSGTFATPAPTPTSSPAPAPKPTETPSPIADDTYLSERYRGRTFESAEQWRETPSEWDSRRTERLDTSKVIRAYGAALLVAQRASAEGNLRNDKWRHCMVGADMTLATELKTAEYAGWFKERSDITDGKPDTTFDEVDHEATVNGARLAIVEQVCDDCANLCEVRCGNRHESWDGTRPPPQRLS